MPGFKNCVIVKGGNDSWLDPRIKLFLFAVLRKVQLVPSRGPTAGPYGATEVDE